MGLKRDKVPSQQTTGSNLPRQTSGELTRGQLSTLSRLVTSITLMMETDPIPRREERPAHPFATPGLVLMAPDAAAAAARHVSGNGEPVRLA